MRIKIMIAAVLLSLGVFLPAWASSRALPEPAIQEVDTSQLNDPHKKPVTPPVPPRGQLLYENHCMACHESVVHIRTTKHTRSLQELRTRVQHWAEYLELRWASEELEDVVGYLNSQYYRFESR
jgi:cytochrome c5